MIPPAAGRTGPSLLVLPIVSFLAFLPAAGLGDPLGIPLPPGAGVAERQALIDRLTLDDPLPVRFAAFLGGLMPGDFGISFRTREGVGAMIAERLPATVELALASPLLTILMGVPLGILCGIGPRSLPARAAMVVSSAAITLAGFQVTFVIRMLRRQLMEVGQSGHIRFARARGIPEGRLRFVYGPRNALLPAVTVPGLQLGNIIAFSLAAESAVARPGPASARCSGTRCRRQTSR